MGSGQMNQHLWADFLQILSGGWALHLTRSKAPTGKMGVAHPSGTHLLVLTLWACLERTAGNVACDHWHTWKDDIALMKSMGLKHYRFSIAWPRVIPDGHYKGGLGVNQKAIAWYNEFINALHDAGITPYVTLYHWDLPQGLLDPAAGKGGWYSVDMATGKPDGSVLPEWKSYVDLCF